MRILHLLKTSVGANWALRQISELVRLGIEVHVVLPCGGPMVGKYAGIGAAEHLLQTDFPIRYPWRFPRLSKTFRCMVQTIQPDIIHSHFVGTTLSMRLALGHGKVVPRVFQVPGPLHLEHSLFRLAEIATAGQADSWIGSCQWTCDRYKQAGIDSGRVFLAYYGLDCETYSQKPRGKLRNELGLGPESKIVGMVAYMYAPKRYLGQKRGLKGHEDLIDAIEICLSHNSNLRCVIVGGAWNGAIAYEQAIRKYALDRCGDRVIFLGSRNDVPDIYADFDVVVHPSHSENVGGAAESCLLGVPTVATSVGGFPDLIHDGKTGWLVPPKSPPILASAILDALGDPLKAKMRAVAAQRLARDLFDVRNSAAKIKSIYEQLLSRA